MLLGHLQEHTQEPLGLQAIGSQLSTQTPQGACPLLQSLYLAGISP